MEKLDWGAHLAIGVFSGFVFSYFFFPSDVFVFCLISGAASLLPDLDTRKSKASQVLFFAVIGAAGAAAYGIGKSLEEFVISFLLICAALFLADRIVRPTHRGVMHSILFLVAASAVCFFLAGELFAAAFFVGYGSHLLADRCLKIV